MNKELEVKQKIQVLKSRIDALKGKLSNGDQLTHDQKQEALVQLKEYLEIFSTLD